MVVKIARAVAPPAATSTARPKPKPKRAEKPKPSPVATEEEEVVGDGAEAGDETDGGDGGVTPAPDLTPEEVDAAVGRPSKPKPRSKRPKGRRHGRPR